MAGPRLSSLALLGASEEVRWWAGPEVEAVLRLSAVLAAAINASSPLCQAQSRSPRPEAV